MRYTTMGDEQERAFELIESFTPHLGGDWSRARNLAWACLTSVNRREPFDLGITDADLGPDDRAATATICNTIDDYGYTADFEQHLHAAFPNQRGQ